MAGMGPSNTPEKSNLAPQAAEVAKYLKWYEEKFVEPREDLSSKSITQLANDLIEKKTQNSLNPTDTLPLLTAITEVRSQLLIKCKESGLDQNSMAKGTTIIDNYANKLVSLFTLTSTPDPNVAAPSQPQNVVQPPAQSPENPV